MSTTPLPKRPRRSSVATVNYSIKVSENRSIDTAYYKQFLDLKEKDSTNKKVIQLENTIRKSNNNCSHDFQNDYYKQNVVNSLNHSQWKEWASFNQSL